MKTIMPDFMIGATNVYRTQYYIVKQNFGIKINPGENNMTFSHDTFYVRTKQRDAEYELIFCNKKHIDGKRLPTTMYARQYVD